MHGRGVTSAQIGEQRRDSVLRRQRRIQRQATLHSPANQLLLRLLLCASDCLQIAQLAVSFEAQLKCIIVLYFARQK